jgi:hypothetical protein
MHRVSILCFVAVLLVPGDASAQGDPLGPEFRVNTYTTSYQGFSAVASDSSGNFVVVWTSEDGSSSGVFGQRYASSGAPLGSEFRVNTYTASYQGIPAVAADSSGNFVVVWNSYEQDGANYGVFGQRYDSSGVPLAPEFRVNTFTTSNQRLPSVASDSSGNFVVVWSSYGQDGSSYGIFGQRFASSGAPLGSEFRVNTYGTLYQNFPSVASDTSGNFVVVWTGDFQDGSTFGVFGQRYASSGAPLAAEFRVNTYTTARQYAASAASDAAGNFVVVWTSDGQDGSNYGIFGQRYASSGRPLGSEFRVNTYTTAYQSLPAVAADSSGNFVVAWTSLAQDGSSDGIFGQRYASSGAPLGSEFRVNTYTTDVQSRASVGADSSGNFVVVWESLDQDGSGFGVFAQRYSQIVPVELMHFRVE